jgi:hypothetical protein
MTAPSIVLPSRTAQQHHHHHHQQLMLVLHRQGGYSLSRRVVLKREVVVRMRVRQGSGIQMLQQHLVVAMM